MTRILILAIALASAGAIAEVRCGDSFNKSQLAGSFLEYTYRYSVTIRSSNRGLAPENLTLAQRQQDQLAIVQEVSMAPEKGEGGKLIPTLAVGINISHLGEFAPEEKLSFKGNDIRVYRNLLGTFISARNKEYVLGFQLGADLSGAQELLVVDVRRINMKASGLQKLTGFEEGAVALSKIEIESLGKAQ